MFRGPVVFNGDISRWDVSSVKDMSNMFWSASSFNGDISKWDVSRVINMNRMFMDAISFKQTLCGHAWVHSQASQKDMFNRSSGSISQTVCGESSPQRWLARWQATDTPVTTSLTAPGFVSSITTCPHCGVFAKSRRVSCCAPGGAWYQNCGGAVNRNFGHTWIQGVEACKCNFNFNLNDCMNLRFPACSI